MHMCVCELIISASDVIWWVRKVRADLSRTGWLVDVSVGGTAIWIHYLVYIQYSRFILSSLVQTRSGELGPCTYLQRKCINYPFWNFLLKNVYLFSHASFRITTELNRFLASNLCCHLFKTDGPLTRFVLRISCRCSGQNWRNVSTWWSPLWIKPVCFWLTSPSRVPESHARTCSQRLVR